MLSRVIFPDKRRIYLASPQPMKRLLVNMEAWKRARFRRGRDYRNLLSAYDPDWYRLPLAQQQTYQLGRLQQILEDVCKYVPYYRTRFARVQIQSLADICHLPLLHKDDVRHDPLSLVRDGVPRWHLWAHLTSGSTGTPLRFYEHWTASRSHTAVADALLLKHGCRFGERRVRFSGADVAEYSQNDPPFWIYIDLFRQLQCSSYHLTETTYADYLRAMREANVVYGTGYATAWHLLATYALDANLPTPRLRALVTDSEGISLNEQLEVERVFGCPVYQTYGLQEVGQVAMQCSHRRYHVLTRSSMVELLDENGRQVEPGQSGQIVVTDLTTSVSPFIRYLTGDIATLAEDPCPCGWSSPSWSEVLGRLDDRIRTPEGRWIGRLSQVTKPAVGVRESQIVQTATDCVVIRVIPASDFEPSSMNAVLETAHRYLGGSMRISWEVADRIPRTKRGKLRHVIREIP